MAEHSKACRSVTSVNLKLILMERTERSVLSFLCGDGALYPVQIIGRCRVQME